MVVRTVLSAVRRHGGNPVRVLARILLAVCVASLAAGAGRAAQAEPGFAPGLYEIELRIGMPHVLRVGEPRRLLRCVSAAELETGSAFSVLSENPLRACPLADYRSSGGAARYRIVCPGANAAGQEHASIPAIHWPSFTTERPAAPRPRPQTSPTRAVPAWSARPCRGRSSASKRARAIRCVPDRLFSSWKR